MNQQTNSSSKTSKKIRFIIKKPAEPAKIDLSSIKSFNELLDQYHHKPAYVVQVGACDCISFDTMFSHLKTNPEWAGVFIEPVPALFKMLVDNFNQHNITPNKIPINYAVAEQNQQYEMFIPTGKPKWLLGCPSMFNNDVVSKFTSTKQLVQGVHFDTIVRQQNIQHIDILQIDTEGYDWIIIQQIIPAFKPSIIKIEQRHLKSADKTKLKKFLTQHNYDFKRIGVDYVCQHK